MSAFRVLALGRRRRIMNSLKFHGYDDMVEGVILFTGLKAMPVEFYHGMVVRFTLIFLDQNENEIRPRGGPVCGPDVATRAESRAPE